MVQVPRALPWRKSIALNFEDPAHHQTHAARSGVLHTRGLVIGDGDTIKGLKYVEDKMLILRCRLTESKNIKKILVYCEGYYTRISK